MSDISSMVETLKDMARQCICPPDNIFGPVADRLEEQQAEIERLRQCLQEIYAIYQGKSSSARTIAYRGLKCGPKGGR